MINILISGIKIPLHEQGDSMKYDDKQDRRKDYFDGFLRVLRSSFALFFTGLI